MNQLKNILWRYWAIYSAIIQRYQLHTGVTPLWCKQHSKHTTQKQNRNLHTEWDNKNSREIEKAGINTKDTHHGQWSIRGLRNIYFDKSDIQFQLVPPHMYWRNAVECKLEHSITTSFPPYSLCNLASPSTYGTASYPKLSWNSTCCGDPDSNLNSQHINS